MKSVLILSIRNLSSNKKVCFAFSFIFTIIMVLVTLTISFSISLREKQISLLNDYYSSNYILSNDEIDFKDEKVVYQEKTFMYFDPASITERLYGISLDYLSSDLLSISVDGIYYESNQSTSFSIVAGQSNDLLNNNDVMELSSQDLIIGSFPTNDNEILVSEPMLESFGLSPDIIGKSLTIASRTNHQAIILDSFIVSGIIKSEYYALSGHKIDYYMFNPTIYMGMTNRFYITHSEEFEPVNQYILTEYLSLEQFSGLSNRYSFIYFAESVITQMGDIASMLVILNSLILIMEIQIGIALVMILYLSVNKFLSQFSKSSGVLLTLGLSNKKISELLLIELFELGFFAFLLALPIEFLGRFGITYLIEATYQINLITSISMFLWMIVIGFALMITFISLIYLGTIYRMKKQTIRDYLLRDKSW
ncbi:MAG: hypothetical protein AB7U79_05250 [Candidatus Izemoplasmatales bacterium]